MTTQNSENSAPLQVSESAMIGLHGVQTIFNKLLQDMISITTSRQLHAQPSQIAMLEGRLNFAFSYYQETIKNIYTWLYDSREDSNFTYDLTETNKLYLASFVAAITGKSNKEIKAYIDELSNDRELHEHVINSASRAGDMSIDINPRFGRRLGWYAFVRALKPKVVIETGVDKGLGSCVLSAALLRNISEGFPGVYYGTDINPAAGYLYHGKYKQAGQIIYGDSIQSLQNLNLKVDLFINDSDHSAQYEENEYQVIKDKLSQEAVILADNAHVTDRLLKFSESLNRNFLYFQEKPANHWYPGAGIGVSFPNTDQKKNLKSVGVEPVILANTAAPAVNTETGRCLFVNTYYDDFLNNLYAANPDLQNLEYSRQIEFLQSQSFGDSDFYSKGMTKAGWQAENIIINCTQLQQRWALENNFSGGPQEIVLEQIKRYKPDVVYCQDMHAMSEAFLNAIRPHCRLIVGQIASAMGNLPLKSYDIIISSILPFVEWFRSLGITSYYQPLAFESTVLDKLTAQSYISRPSQCTFVGGLYSSVHVSRQTLLEQLANDIPIEFYGYGVNNLPQDSLIRKKFRGEAWGNTMFQALQNSKITINIHAEHRGCGGPLVKSKEHSATEFYANNMRLYEATGCGALLITDYKDNLNDLFEIGKEVVAYRSAEECLALVKYYLKNPLEAEAIAAAGQKRTLQTHSYALRLDQTAEILSRHLEKSTNSEMLPELNLEKISYGYSKIEQSEVTVALTAGWKDSSIPAKQRSLVNTELSEMYKGEVRGVFRVLNNIIKPVLKENMSVLEIGCSSGYYYEAIEYLSNKRINYTGVDYSEEMISMAKNYYPNADFFVRDGAKLGFDDNKFELVISGCVLLHVPNYEAHIAETCRVASQYIVAHRTPICRVRPTHHLKKFAYDVETVELRFNETEILNLFNKYGCQLVEAEVYHNAPQQDEYEASYLFKIVK